MRLTTGSVTRRIKGSLRALAGLGVRRQIALGLVLALVALTAWQGNEWRRVRGEQDLRSQAVDVADSQVVALTTMTAETVEGRLDEMQRHVTGSFASQLERFASVFASAVKTSKVTAKGQIEMSGVEKYSGKSATILVASSASIQTAKQKRATVRNYRMRVDLERQSGEWLVSGMEFVP
jgi:Mce-associated membrane protein